MCLAVPGKITYIDDSASPLMAKVDFGGISKDVCLDFLNDAKVGNYVLVHVGFALSIVDEKEAQETIRLFEDMERGYLESREGEDDEIH